jgi:hypothetical protein
MQKQKGKEAEGRFGFSVKRIGGQRQRGAQNLPGGKRRKQKGWEAEGREGGRGRKGGQRH